jgi:hypothetical protein
MVLASIYPAKADSGMKWQEVAGRGSDRTRPWQEGLGRIRWNSGASPTVKKQFNSMKLLNY